MHPQLVKKEFANCVIKDLINTMFATILFFMKSEGDTIVSLTKALAHYAR